jgi:hypothetical protein
VCNQKKYWKQLEQIQNDYKIKHPERFPIRRSIVAGNETISSISTISNDKSRDHQPLFESTSNESSTNESSTNESSSNESSSCRIDFNPFKRKRSAASGENTIIISSDEEETSDIRPQEISALINQVTRVNNLITCVQEKLNRRGRFE